MYFKAHGFDLVRPDSLSEAIAAHGGASGAAYLAGGTALLSSRYAAGGDFPSLLVSLSKIDGLTGISNSDGAISIGALTPLTELETDERIAAAFPALSEALVRSGSWQVRIRATIGGNIANASPTADLGPPLVSLGARIRYQDERGEHQATVEEVWINPGELKLPSAAVITAVEIPVPGGASGSCYQRLDLRRAMDTAMAGVSVAVSLDDGGRVRDARIVLGGVTGVPTRVTKAEKALTGTAVDDASALGEVSAVVETEARNPKLLKTRSSPTIAGYLRRSKSGAKDRVGEYRVRVAPTLATRAIELALERAAARRNGDN